MVVVTPKRFLKALDATAKHAARYKLLRDWYEFYRAGHERDYYPTPKSFVMFCLLTAPELRNSSQAEKAYRALVEVLGKEELHRAAEVQCKKEKTAEGHFKGAAEQFPWLTHLMWEVARGSDRNYFLITAARQQGAGWKPEYFEIAARQFDALTAIYGRDTLMGVVHHVRTAPRIVINIPADRFSKARRLEYVPVPNEYKNLPKFKKHGRLHPLNAIEELLKLKPARKLSLPAAVPSGIPEIKLSADNRFDLGKTPSKYRGADIAIHKGTAIVGVESPYAVQKGGLFRFGRAANPASRVLIFREDLADRSLTVFPPSKSLRKFGSSVDVHGGVAVVTALDWASTYDVTTGKPLARLMPPKRGFYGRNFGWSVAMHHDVIVVGAPELRPDDGLAGNVYLFGVKDGKYRATLNARGKGPFVRRFGHAVDTDGRKVVIGARGQTDADSGAFLFYAEKEQEGRYFGRLKPPEDPDGSGKSAYGESVAIEKDWVVVGAPWFNKTGAVCVYALPSGGIRHVLQVNQRQLNFGRGAFAKLILSQMRPAQRPIRDREFGRCVAVADGTLIAGSSGAAHVFDLKTGHYLAKIVPPTSKEGQPRGVVAVDCDGHTAVLTVQIGDYPGSMSNHRLDLKDVLEKLRKKAGVARSSKTNAHRNAP